MKPFVRWGLLALLLTLGTVAVVRCGSDAVATVVYKQFLIVANNAASSSNVHAHPVDDTTGAVSASTGALTTSSDPWVVALSPDGRFAYSGGLSAGGISGYSIDKSTGVMTALTGSPYEAPQALQGLVLRPDGKFLYASSYTGNTLSIFSVNTDTGVLTQVGVPMALLGQPFYPVVDKLGKFLYVPLYGGTTIAAFSIDSATGTLSAVAGSPFTNSGAGALWLALTPDGKYLYSSNLNGSSLSLFSANTETGVLTPLAAPMAVSNPRGLKVSPDGKTLYLAVANPASVNYYTIDPNGTLTPGASSPVLLTETGEPTDLAVDATGKRLYVARYVNSTGTSGLMNVMDIDATGKPTDVANSPFDICVAIMSMAVARIAQ